MTILPKRGITIVKKTLIIMFALLIALPLVASVSDAKTSYLNEVNATCGTNYGCGLCHIDPKGGGPLTSGGSNYANAGHDACYFCPATCNNPVCTDGDRDNYFAESNCGTSVDCNDASAAINPGATEVCNDGVDNDCDGKIDCADNECSTDQACAVQAEICNDSVDNDGDRKVDCADRDCRRDPACTATSGGTEGKGKTCNDGKDNDGDGSVDCADTDCSANRVCK